MHSLPINEHTKAIDYVENKSELIHIETEIIDQH